MLKNLKKLAVVSLIAVSAMGVMPVGASAEWKQDSQNTYYWTEDGVNARGWKNIGNEWYYFSNDGKMQVSWVQTNGNWYYLWSNGMMAHDTWVNSAGGWYYFDSTGKMISDTTNIGKREYDFRAPAIIISNDLGASKATFPMDGQTTTGAAVTVK
ncbi:phage tail protein [Clostridium sp. C2-6-12]|uniref:phage tail protein n=1 Tax=Clostridium sp. C2-6-12 TaxID=2698832 RepID=UPI00136DD732|nr:phage tail protein [Clostridium sp. C2-6-12]